MSRELDRQYFKSPALSKSRIDLLLECPALYKADLDGTAEPEETDALRFGSMAHTLTLEPAVFAEEYAVTDLNLTTKEGKAWKAALPEGVEVVKMDNYDKAQIMAEAVRSHPQAKMLFQKCEAEKPVYWQEDGLPCKCKPDLISEVYGHRFLGDLKTTDSANPDSIRKSIEKYAYYRQAAWYLRGMEAVGKPCDAFIFIFIEKKFPHLVTMCQLSDEWLERGWDECCKAMNILRDCQRTGLYPCYTREILTLDMPKWAKGA